MGKRWVGVLLLLALWSAGSGQCAVREQFVAPDSTDPEIREFLSPHFVAWRRQDAADPQGAARGELFVFFAGTGGRPLDYREIVRTAAELGYHAIGLSYKNPDAINTLCGGLNRNLDCYGDARMEVIDGIDRSPLVDVSRANSIENRLRKLLLRLQADHPGDGWQQYLDGSQITWARTVLAGHSQGGGHAGILGKTRRVRRVLMFAAMDWSGLLQRPANWITAPSATPPAAFRAFTHEADEFVRFSTLLTHIWPALGMDVYGAPQRVEDGPPPYRSHSLYSNRAATSGNHHGAIVTDARLDRLPDGRPVYRPVWEHLLAEEEAAGPVAHVSAASFQAGPVTAAMIVSAFGAQLSQDVMSATQQPLPTELGEVRVQVRDSAGRLADCGLLFVSPGQVNYVLPSGLAVGAATLTVHSPHSGRRETAVQVAAVRPGLFAANGDGAGAPAAWLLRIGPGGDRHLQAAAEWDESAQRYRPTPIAPLAAGERLFLELFGTGIRGRSSLQGAVATVGNASAPVTFAGAHSSFAGLDQVNVELPGELSGRGTVELRLVVDGVEANPLSLFFP